MKKDDEIQKIEILQIPIDISQMSFSFGIATITAQTKASPKLRDKLRGYLEPRTNGSIEAINQELLEPAIKKLKQQGSKGLVVIVDNLDRVDATPKASGRPQPEYLFADRGAQLKGLHCHVVYTIPLALRFSKDYSIITQRFMVDPQMLPMVPVQLRDGREHQAGMALLRQMVLARAFPYLETEQRLSKITEIFDSPETLNRLCRVSGGHVRNLLVLLYSCLQENDPPIERDCLEMVIREYRDDLISAISEEEWTLLHQILQQKDNVKGEEEYQTLLRSMFLFEYRDVEGRWFDINPAIAESRKFKL